jgi:LacI family transcriptional regulator
MKSAPKKITMAQIAKAAGVGTGTVSRVLNGDTRVSEATRRMVTDVIRKRGYRPHASARNLARKSTRMICFMMSNRSSMHLFNVKTLNGALACCEAAGYTVVYTHFNYSADVSHDELTPPSVVLERGMIDGVILVGINHENFVQRLATMQLPFVLHTAGYVGRLNRKVSGFDLVSMDDTGGVERATRYLIGLGHTRIGFVGDIALPWFDRRFAGYSAAMKEAGLPPQVEWSRENEPDNFLAGMKATERILQGKEHYTALVAGDDLVMLGVFNTLRKHRFTVPDDVSLVGFGDSDEIRYHLTPALTTIRAPRFEMGSEMARMLLSRIESPGRRSRELILPTELVLRESCRRQRLHVVGAKPRA